MKKSFLIIVICSLLVFDISPAFSYTMVNTQKNILVDGNMERSGVTAWSTDASTSKYKISTTTPHGGKQSIRVAYQSGSTSQIYQAVFTAGKKYRVTGFARGDGISGKPLVMNLAVAAFTGTASAAWQYFDVVFVATDSYIRLRNQFAGVGRYVDFDDVVITEITTGNTVNTQKNILVDGNMERATAASWTANNSAMYYKVSTTTVHSGKKIMRVAYNGVNNPSIRQTTLDGVGKKYRATGWARGDGTFVPNFINWLAKWTGTNSTAWQYFDVVWTRDTNDIVALGCNAISAGWCDFDDIVITEITAGNTVNTQKNILVDGNMERAATTWTVVNGNVYKISTTTPHSGKKALRVEYSGTALPYTSKSALGGAGKKYRVTGFARGDGTFTPRFGNWLDRWTGTASTAWQYFDVTWTRDTNDLIYLRCGATSAGWCDFDDIVITEIPK